MLGLVSWGNGRRPRIRGGRRPPNLLFMAATSVTRWIPDLKAVDKRLLADGRDHNLAVVATMHKVLALLGALPRDGRLPTPEPSPPEAAV